MFAADDEKRVPTADEQMEAQRWLKDAEKRKRERESEEFWRSFDR